MLGRIFQKRLNHFLDSMEKEEVKFDEYILKETHAAKLDPVRKKKLEYPSVFYPVKNVPLEWWYFTGHLQSGKKRFGFEFCFFKFHPQGLRIGPLPASIFRKEPYLVFHGTITDKENKNFTVYQDSGIIDKENISYDSVDISLGRTRLRLSKNKFIIDAEWISLELIPIKKMIKHFEEGYAVMYKYPEHRTYYVTFPRLKVKGKILSNGKENNVTGQAWFDHQKTNMPHKTSLKGWDWFSVMLEDNTELMFFTLRNKKGMDHKFMGGSFIDKNSKKIDLKQNEVFIKHIKFWKSPKTGIIYPSGWIMEIPKLGIKLEIIPCMENQEVDAIKTTPTSYWEGACDVSGTKNGKKIKGQSYVELVGYDNRFVANLIRDLTY